MCFVFIVIRYYSDVTMFLHRSLRQKKKKTISSINDFLPCFLNGLSMIFNFLCLACPISLAFSKHNQRILIIFSLKVLDSFLHLLLSGILQSIILAAHGTSLRFLIETTSVFILMIFLHISLLTMVHVQSKIEI